MAIDAEPPTKANITQVAHDVRRYWDSGGYYCPNVCYEIKAGRMHLMRCLDIPDAGSDTKLLFTVMDKHPRNKMSDYRADIYQKLRSVGVGVDRTPTKKNVYKAAKAARRMSWDNECAVEIRVKFDEDDNRYHLEATLGPKWDESEESFGFLLYTYEDDWEEWNNKTLADFIWQYHLQRLFGWFDRVRYDWKHKTFAVEFEGALYDWNPDILHSNDYDCGAPNCIANADKCEGHVERMLRMSETAPLEVFG